MKVGDEITLRRAESLADYKACQRAQEQAWDIAEPGYLIPIATMVGANLHGGLVLARFCPVAKPLRSRLPSLPGLRGASACTPS